MNATLRRCFGLLAAILLYYLVHEGAHAAVAHFFGVLQSVRPLGLGMQVVLTDPAALTPFQFALFNAAGAFCTLLTAYIMVFFAKRLAALSHKAIRAACYYITLLFLLNDPIYLSVLCGFFGGGDMNGIVQFGVSAWAARLFFGLTALVNLALFMRIVYPAYRAGCAAG